MQNPHPKQLAVAVPANLRAGRPDGAAPAPAATWAPRVANIAGGMVRWRDLALPV